MAALSFLMLDIDHFKLVNDISGHAAGGLVLPESTTGYCGWFLPLRLNCFFSQRQKNPEGAPLGKFTFNGDGTAVRLGDS